MPSTAAISPRQGEVVRSTRGRCMRGAAAGPARPHLRGLRREDLVLGARRGWLGPVRRPTRRATARRRSTSIGSRSSTASGHRAGTTSPRGDLAPSASCRRRTRPARRLRRWQVTHHRRASRTQIAGVLAERRGDGADGQVRSGSVGTSVCCHRSAIRWLAQGLKYVPYLLHEPRTVRLLFVENLRLCR